MGSSCLGHRTSTWLTELKAIVVMGEGLGLRLGSLCQQV